MVVDIATVLAHRSGVIVHSDGWQTAAAVATCITAIAALATARTSLATSRDARRALGLSTRPHLGTMYQEQGRTLVASVRNHNQYAAADVSVEIRLRDGQLCSDSAARIEEAPGPMSKSGPWRAFRFEDALSDEPHVPIGRFIDRAAMRWCDAQRILLWEEVTTFFPEGGQEQVDRLIGEMPYPAPTPVKRAWRRLGLPMRS
jgi:hypothetical protein